MTLTLNTFVAGSPGEARSFADALRDLGKQTDAAATGAHRARAHAAGEWDGAASEAFQAWAKSQGTDGEVLAEAYPAMARAHDVWADEISTVQARMEQAKQVARDGGLRIMGTNLILPPKTPAMTQPELPPGRATTEQLSQHSKDVAAFEAAMAEYHRQQAAWEEVKATVENARQKERLAHEAFVDALDKTKAELKGLSQAQHWEQAGTQSASALGQAATAMEASAAEATRSMFERSIGNPAATSVAWSAFTSAQRTDLIDRFPSMVGNADGVPAVARDQANRSILAAQRQAIVNKMNSIRQEIHGEIRHRKHGNVDVSRADDLQTLQQALNGIDKLQDKLGGSAEQSGYYLLGLDSTADDRGQAIVAQGNPDHADNTMTLAPGTFSDLQDVTDYVEDNHQVLERANQLAPDKNNVAITWASYESPNTLVPGAATSGYAEDAAPELSDFQEGLRTTHQGDSPSNNTLVGHSYGSTVVGETSHTDGSYADNIVFLGSPGTGVDEANKLDVPRDHVWAGKAGDDIIDITPSTDVRRWIPTITGETDYARFGTDPTDPAFGGRMLPTAPDGVHGDYWRQSQSRDAMAEIMTNKGGN